MTFGSSRCAGQVLAEFCLVAISLSVLVGLLFLVQEATNQNHEAFQEFNSQRETYLQSNR